jgi:hypothetical protein
MSLRVAKFEGFSEVTLDVQKRDWIVSIKAPQGGENRGNSVCAIPSWIT